eukprot:CAMPEP_0194433030 /NCGR_PEP_ID=MMETSP0176-20130528/74414_1 /TAXON_ID=216777 /ORGANISM="Proboscia alata, Strain PI-D3" /LENGTH=33 /DNA_ID= /DNA_START= /DNA_END= /DNA_ORIENTATION=
MTMNDLLRTVPEMATIISDLDPLYYLAAYMIYS